MRASARVCVCVCMCNYKCIHVYMCAGVHMHTCECDNNKEFLRGVRGNIVRGRIFYLPLVAIILPYSQNFFLHP